MDNIPNGVFPVMLTPFKEDGSIDFDGVATLTDWYIDAGVAGLFACCLSSEMYELTSQERLDLVKHVVEVANNRVPVVASGTFGGELEKQAEFIHKMLQQGVQAVVILTCQIAPEDADDAEWIAQAEKLLELTDDVPLGLYECPVPFKRLLSPDIMQWTGSAGRFGFLKETSCSTSTIQEKVSAAGDKLKLFNANCPTLLNSLRNGAAGYSGIAANFFPELYVWLCENYVKHPETAEELQAWLSVADMAVRHKYPASAKSFLMSRGLPITAKCRVSDIELNEDSKLVLESLEKLTNQWLNRLHLI